MDNNYLSAIEEYIKNLEFKKLRKQAFREIKVCRSNLISSCIIIIIGLILAGGLLSKEDSIERFKSVVDFIFEANLSIFSCILAVYSIVHAFLSDDFIKRASKIKLKKESVENILSKYTFYYDSILTLLFFSLCVSGISIIVLKCFDDLLIVFLSKFYSLIISFMSISVYLVFSIRVFYELKSVIFNTVSLFRFSIAYRLFYLSKKDE